MDPKQILKMLKTKLTHSVKVKDQTYNLPKK